MAGAPEASLLPCRPGYRAALKWGTGPQVPEDVAAVWAACLEAMQRVSQLLSQPRPPSDSVRMLAARFLENAMLLISAEPSSTAKAPKAQHALLSAASVHFVLCNLGSTVFYSYQHYQLPGHRWPCTRLPAQHAGVSRAKLLCCLPFVFCNTDSGGLSSI